MPYHCDDPQNFIKQKATIKKEEKKEESKIDDMNDPFLNPNIDAFEQFKYHWCRISS